MNEIPTTGPWPAFRELEGRTSFPDWLLTSAAEIVEAHGERLKGIHVYFWGISEYNDNTNVERRAAIELSWCDDSERPSEDDLDLIPAMRRIYRRAAELWDCVPMDLDSEAGVCGEYEFTISREGLEFWIDDYSENRIEARAKLVGGDWNYTERFEFFPELSEIARASLTAGTVIDEVDLKPYFDNEKVPDPVALEWEDDSLILIFGKGLFPAYIGQGE